MHFRIQRGESASIFVSNGDTGPVRQEELISQHFHDFPESMLTMLLDRCDQEVAYLREPDLRYMAARIAALLKLFLEKAPPLDESPEIVVPTNLKKVIQFESETMGVKEFITIFASKKVAA